MLACGWVCEYMRSILKYRCLPSPSAPHHSMQPMYYLIKTASGEYKLEVLPQENGDYRVMAADYVPTNMGLGFLW